MPRFAALRASAGALVALVVFAAGIWAGHSWRDRSARADLAECQQATTDMTVAMLQAAHRAEAEYRAREAQIEKDHTEALYAANLEAAAARSDAARVRAALERLRIAAADAARRGGAAPSAAPAASGPPAGPAADLPADVLVRLGEAAGELAAAADDARIAGTACQRAYNALTVPRLGGGQ